MNHESCASFVDEEELDVVNLRLSDVDGNRADNINPLVIHVYSKHLSERVS